MALPAYSPVGGIGSLYTDPETGASYVFQGGTNWQQISSGALKPPTAQPSQPKPVTQQQSTYPADKYIGWGPTEAQADWNAKQQQGGGQPSGGGQDDMMRRIEDLYNISTGALNELYSNIQNVELPTALSGLDLQKTQMQRQLETAGTEAEQEFTGQTEEAKGYQQSALSEARRAYNALYQGISARYGMGASTGGAMTEIAAQAFMRTQGDIDARWNKTMTAIFNERGKIFKFLKDKEMEIEENHAQKLKEVNAEFSSRLQEISMQKAMNEQAKAAAKIEVLQQAQARAQEWADAVKLAKLNLEIYRQQIEYESQAAVDWTADQVANAFSGEEYTQSKTMSGATSPLLSLGYGANASSNAGGYAPYALAQKEDKFKNVLNPFA